MRNRHQPDFYDPTKQAKVSPAPMADGKARKRSLQAVQVPGKKGFPETPAKIDKYGVWGLNSLV
jgi:hypothetical protein